MPNWTEVWKTFSTQKHPVRLAVALALKKSGTHRFFSVRHQDFRIPFDRSSLAMSLWIDPARVEEDRKLLQRVLRPGDTVVDIGANIGSHTMIAAKLVGAHGRVFAVEAHPRIFRVHSRNIALNRYNNVTSFNVALGAHKGVVRFSDRGDDDTQNTVLTDNIDGIEVPVEKLDDLAIQIGPIALMKVDVEGYEKSVFEGGLATLARTAVIYFEAWDQHFMRHSYKSAELWALLRAQGFALYRLENNEQLVPLGSNEQAPQCRNYLALRDTQDFCARTGFFRASGASSP
jgi:FkbM family methyltransferase